ncbi:MAG: hypothetical protein ACE5MI_14435 [Acidimicrobiia bacterium]
MGEHQHSEIALITDARGRKLARALVDLETPYEGHPEGWGGFIHAQIVSPEVVVKLQLSEGRAAVESVDSDTNRTRIRGLGPAPF